MSSNNRGFTMIELMLSMGFVAFLMITIALTTISMSRTYERGLTLTQLNTAGRAITSDMQTTVQQSSSSSLKSYNLPHGATGLPGSTITGRVYCFGQYSYIYNTGIALADTRNTFSSSVVTYTGGGSLNGQPVRLAKVSDPTEALCGNPAPTTVDQAKATELLPAGGRGLAIQQTGNSVLQGGLLVTNLLQPTAARYNLQLPTGTGLSGLQALYKIDFTLGTNDQSAINTTNFSCQPPSDQDSNLTYCAVNHFSFIVRTSGGGN